VFWTAGWYHKLELPGLAMLLVLLAEKDDVVLPLDRIPRWYGISRATAQRGFKELLQHDLIATWVTSRTAPLAPAGITYDTHYRLTGPFDRHSTVPPPREMTSGSIAEFAEAAAALSASQRRRSRRRKPKSSTTSSTERRKSK
jgi:hypothetical protein